MSTLTTTVLARLGTAALVFAAGAWAGWEGSARSTAAAGAAELRRVSALYLQAVADGDTRAKHLQQQLDESKSFTADLAQRSRNVPTLVRTSCPQAAPGATHRGPPGPVVAQPAHGAGAGAAPLPADAAQDAPAEHPTGEPTAPGVAGSAAGHPLDGGLGLTAGAVSLWNSALAGRYLPAGACSLADPASAACAADTEISLEDAWDNQARNAAACRADRARLAALIDYLHARQTGAAR